MHKVRHVRKNGLPLFVNIRVSPSEYPGQKVFLVATSDITKRLEAEQKEAEARAAEEKRKTMNLMADDLQTSVGAVVDTVAAAAEEMESSARSMSVPQAAIWGLTSFRELWGEVMAQKELRRYLLAYFFYIDGVLTAIYMSSTLASNTFGYEQAELIYLYLAIQIAALIGAFLLAKPTDRVGPKKVVTGVLGLWIAIAIAIFFIESKAAFAVVGLLAGFGLGSIQAASRAFMASLIPDGRESEMFGFYALCGKSSSVIGPLIFGQVALMTGGNQKLSVMSISVLFVFGAILLQRVKDPKAAPVAA